MFHRLFQFVLTNPNRVLSSLLADNTDQHYHLRARCHDTQLVDKCNKLFSNNFIMRMLYINCYWFVYKLCSANILIKVMMMMMMMLLF